MPKMLSLDEDYPVFIESKPEIPVRSKFYHLQPLGIGMSMSECLTSYICRLATAHSVSVGSLFEFALVPALKKDYLKAADGFGPASKLLGTYRNQIKNINGIGKIAQDWVNVVEKMTLRTDLSDLTFLKLSEVISRSYVNRKFQAWCPFCLEEMKNDNAELYYPLFWSLVDVKVCHVHRIPLLDICTNCSRKFLPLSMRVRLGFCSRCKLWLGISQNQNSKSLTQFSEKELEWNLFVSEEISKLIAFISNPSTKAFTNPLSQTIRLCVERATNGGISPFARLIQIHLSTFHGWYKGRQRPHLKDILRICYCLNLTLLDFLTQPEIIETKEITIREWLGIEKRHPRPSPRSFNTKLVKSKLKKYIDVYPPLSFTQICRKICYDMGIVGKAFPDIKNKIQAKYGEYQKHICKTKRSELEKEIKSAVYELERKGIFVSADQVANFLNKPSYKGRRDVAQIVFGTRKIGKPGKNFNG